MPIENAIAWIDPLDGTRDFTKGNLAPVTSISGITVNGVAKIGVVHKPVSYKDDQISETFFGSIETGVFKMDFNPRAEKDRQRGEI